MVRLKGDEMPRLTEFNPDTHTYKIDGREVPSVTQIIAETIGISWAADEWYLNRGKVVHKYAALIAQGKSFEPPDERIAGRVAAIQGWYAEHKPDNSIVESQVFSLRYRFAGTFDLAAYIADAPYLIDWKSSGDIERTRLQLAGYAIAWGDKSPRLRGFEVILRDDGTYKMSEPLELISARREFLALRAVYGIKERLGVLTKKGNGNGRD